MKNIFISLLIFPLLLNAQDFVINTQQQRDVFIQDQYTQPIVVNFNKIGANTTLKYDAYVDSTFIVVSDTTGIGANTYVIVFNPVQQRFSTFNRLSNSNDTIFLDTPLDVAYDSASYVDFSTKEMNVDGSTTSQTFGIRGASPSPLGITVDITRIIFSCTTSGLVDLSKFADIAGGLTNGLVLRKRDGSYYNVFNVKTNQELAGLMYDWQPYASANPIQGQDGFVSRLTFGGQEKIGVVIRLAPGDDLEFLVQDDLSGITSFQVMAEGHIVE